MVCLWVVLELNTLFTLLCIPGISYCYITHHKVTQTNTAPLHKPQHQTTPHHDNTTHHLSKPNNHQTTTLNHDTNQPPRPPHKTSTPNHDTTPQHNTKHHNKPHHTKQCIASRLYVHPIILSHVRKKNVSRTHNISQSYYPQFGCYISNLKLKNIPHQVQLFDCFVTEEKG